MKAWLSIITSTFFKPLSFGIKISSEAGMTSKYDLEILENTKTINEFDILINKINILQQYAKLYFKIKN